MMEIDEHRYKGPASVRESYMREYLVECPKCGKDAVVSRLSYYSSSPGKLACANCMFSISTKAMVRYKLIVKRNCDHCGKPNYTEIPNQQQKSANIKVTCPHCGTTRNCRARNEEYRLFYDAKGMAADPLFNLPLWLQTTIKGNVLWAFNRRHLLHIKLYVQAKLRERQSNGYTTMVEKLPQFIKEAKNRAALLKAIDQLERK